jgi:hypothetical protein
VSRESACPAVARLRLRQRNAARPAPAGAEPDALGLAFVLRALAAAPSASLQLLVAPTVDSRQPSEDGLDEPGTSLIGHLLQAAVRALIGVPFHLLYGSTSAPAAPPASTPAPAVQAEPTFRGELRLRVCAPARREARMHAEAIAGTLRSLDGRTRWRPTRVLRSGAFDRAHAAYRPTTSGHSLVRPGELAALFHLGGEVPPIREVDRRSGATADRTGKLICLTGSSLKPATISVPDARQHIHLLGSTGGGKTTLIENLALDDIVNGRGVAVIDPKGDLIQAILERIPLSEWDRVVLIDPAARERSVGLNAIACLDPERRELVVDRMITIFKKLYEQSWGARTDDVFRCSLLTLLHRPDSTICELPLLLLHPERFAELIDGLGDPVMLDPFWREYRAYSAGERLQRVGPVLNKLRAVLLRPTIRNIFGQSSSTIDLAQCMDAGRIVLVSLAKGLLGEETSRLIGAFLIARFWQATLARAAQPEEERRDFVLYLDEFQNYLHLPNALDEVLAEARGYHLGLVLANQHLGQLTTAARDAIAANARTRVVFQCGQDDARTLAREFEPTLGERDLRDLARFQVAVRLCTNGRTGQPFTGFTRPERPSLGPAYAAALRRHALTRFGKDRADVERAIEQRLASLRDAEPDPADIARGRPKGPPLGPAPR